MEAVPNHLVEALVQNMSFQPKGRHVQLLSIDVSELMDWSVSSLPGWAE
jgi:hypothetical protein